ncbi:hypothetical protein BH18ACT2_BH18ACT2_08070 [soil metagenome]
MTDKHTPIPNPPTGTKAAGRRLWRSIVDRFELEEHEAALLRAAVATVDLIDVLQRDIDKRGPVVESPQGVKANPAVVEVRQQRLVLARLLAALRLPAGDEADVQRPQRRGGVRGLYRVPGAAS